MNPRLFHVDAFTDQPFAGNPAVVCLLDSPRDDRWMQHVAHEMRVSETAFLLPGHDGFQLRWFTPLVEVDLCGHATLAAAHVLWETGRSALDRPARFHTRSGVLTATLAAPWIELDFPATLVHASPAPAGYLAGLGITHALFVGRAGPRHLVEVATPDIVRSLRPDFAALRALPGRGIAVTARGDGRPYDFVSRYFAPWVGVDEDPVTGSVHCALAGFWASRLARPNLLACQASARGGEIRLRVEGERVHLGGRAVTIASGELSV